MKCYENEENCGYDKNLRTLLKRATGEYVMFMGDDDMYIPRALDQYIALLVKEKPGYVLRRCRTIHKDGSTEEYRYAKENAFLSLEKISMSNSLEEASSFPVSHSEEKLNDQEFLRVAIRDEQDDDRLISFLRKSVG